MPGYKGHIAGALLFCGLLYLFPFWQPLPFEGKVACVILAIFFGLWPDVDTKSRGQYIFLLGVFIADSLLIYRQDYERAAYLGLLVLLPIMSRHRGWTHSLTAMVLIPGGLFLAVLHYSGGPPGDWFPYFLAALLGYASHLVLDRF